MMTNRIETDAVRERATGRWLEVLAAPGCFAMWPRRAAESATPAGRFPMALRS